MKQKDIDLIVINGKIATMNQEQPQAEALAVKEGIIIAVGKNEEIIKQFKEEALEVVDLEGKFLCPGFNDTHTHLLSRAVRAKDVNLAETTSRAEALKKIKEKVEQTLAGFWIFGYGWDETNWDEKRYLTLKELDEIAPNNPCFIPRVCGHLAVVNSLALKELQIGWDDPDLAINQETKEPRGIITNVLMERIKDSPKLKRSQKEIDEAVKLACKLANSLGITSITENLGVKQVKAYISAWKKGELSIRAYLNIPRDKFDHYLEAGLKTGFGDEFVRIGGVKIFTDGSLGARTAALKKPYFDDPSTTGVFYIEEEVFKKTIKQAIESEWQTATHAIGDGAIELILQSFEEIGNPSLIRRGRHRIEHAEYLSEEHLKRANELGLMLSMQPNFPGRWGKPGQLYEIRLGPERFKLLNNFRKIIDSRALLCFGSDNMPMGPLFGIWSVVAHPIDDIRISAEEALYYYTLGATYSSFEEEVKGSIEPGKLADFVVLDKNLLEIDAEEIKDVKVLMTLVGGKIAYKAT